MAHLTLNDKDLKQGVVMTFSASVIAVASISLRRLHARASFNEVFLNHNDRGIIQLSLRNNEVFLNHNDRNYSVVVKES